MLPISAYGLGPRTTLVNDLDPNAAGFGHLDTDGEMTTWLT